jgi:hypothetical protein
MVTMGLIWSMRCSMVAAWVLVMAFTVGPGRASSGGTGGDRTHHDGGSRDLEWASEAKLATTGVLVPVAG